MRAKYLFCAERGSDFLGYFAGADEVARAQRDGGYAGMASAAVFFAERREIDVRRNVLPRVRAHGDFCPGGRRADADGIEGVGIQKIRDELVVALEVQVAHVEIDHR